MKDALLKLESVSCAYDGPTVVEGVSLEVRAGEFVAIAGPNGSGKTTLLRAASRAMAPRSGRVLLDGRDLYEETDAKSAARRLAVVPQDAVVEFDFLALEIVLMGRYPHLGRFDAETERDREAARQAMERTDTWELRDRPITELSGGERRRVLMARALAQEAQILLLDEPTSHLDIHFQVEILRLLKNHVDAGGASVAVMHDLNLAAAFASRVVLLQEGRVTGEGPPREMLVEEKLKSVFGPHLEVRAHPDGGPLVLPRIP
ncbi:MAG: ABC transporter ATP-binding protein [Planctomycetes bacterium]|nr:ABC transporter ATP-binding protein [Planctomycetota bacterium]